MSNKLTKNDSVNVEKLISDLKSKNVQPDFDVLIAAFDAMLSRNGIRLDYYATWAERHPVTYGSTLYQDWLRWAKLGSPKCWLLGAFDFFSTNIPNKVWINLSSQWLNYLKANLKK